MSINFPPPWLNPVHGKPTGKQLVFLVPGIRDFGGWTGRAEKVLTGFEDLIVVPVSYGFYDAISFVSPVDASERPFRKLFKKYQDAVNQYPNASVSFIAHSFGTYLVARLLQECEIRNLHRIIFCGSVLDQSHDWRTVLEYHASFQRPLMNLCGNTDLWPMVAHAIRKRYGYAGRYGFENEAKNVWQVGGHATFFSPDKFRQWASFLDAGSDIPAETHKPIPLIMERLVFSLPLALSCTRIVSAVLWALLVFWWLFLLGAVSIIGFYLVRAG